MAHFTANQDAVSRTKDGKFFHTVTGVGGPLTIPGAKITPAYTFISDSAESVAGRLLDLRLSDAKDEAFGRGSATIPAIAKVLDQPLFVQPVRNSGSHGQGWLIPTSAPIGGIGGVIIDQETVEIARRALKASGAGFGATSGSASGGTVSATCNISSTVSNSSLGSSISRPCSSISISSGLTSRPSFNLGN